MAINGHNINDIVDYWIPESLKGNNIPETEIYVPIDAVGLYAYEEKFENKKKNYTAVEFFDNNTFIEDDIFQGSLEEFYDIAQRYLIAN